MDRELVLPADFGDYRWEVESKGYFSDASVRIDDRLLSVTFYDPARLAQDVTDELVAGRPFITKRLLVIARVTYENMQASVARAPAELFEQ